MRTRAKPLSMVLMKVKVSVAQSCLILCDPTDCSPLGSSVHGIPQARILEWVAIPFSRGSSWPRDWAQVSCIAAGSLPSEPQVRCQIQLSLGTVSHFLILANAVSWPSFISNLLPYLTLLCLKSEFMSSMNFSSCFHPATSSLLGQISCFSSLFFACCPQSA